MRSLVLPIHGEVSGEARRRGYAEYVRRHRVQTRARKVLPATVTRPIWRFGKNLRLTRFFAWLTWCPYCGVLPQIAHCLAMGFLKAGVGGRARLNERLRGTRIVP